VAVRVIILRSQGEVTVVVYDSKITAMNAPGGMVYRYADNKADATVRFAKAFAPKRSGRLAGGISKELRQTSKDRVVARIRSRARYSTWVHEGVPGLIYPKNGRYLSIPRTKAHPWNATGHGRILKPFVRGQTANPFLERALRAGMATGGSFPTPLGPDNPFL
jgi:hypothetical protein